MLREMAELFDLPVSALLGGAEPKPGSTGGGANREGAAQADPHRVGGAGVRAGAGGAAVSPVCLGIQGAAPANCGVEHDQRYLQVGRRNLCAQREPG